MTENNKSMVVKKLNVKIEHLERKFAEVDELIKTIKNLQEIVNDLKVKNEDMDFNNMKDTPESKGKSKQKNNKEKMRKVEFVLNC